MYKVNRVESSRYGLPYQFQHTHGGLELVSGRSDTMRRLFSDVQSLDRI